MKVREWMHSGAVVIAAETSIAAAVEMMDVAAVAHLPIVRDGQLLGLVSKSTLLRYLPSHATTLARYEWPELLAPLTALRALDHAALAVTAADSLEQVATLMRDHHVDALPVLDAGEVIGIIRSSDLLDALCVLLRAA